jgi:hypothetical protein
MFTTKLQAAIADSYNAFAAFPLPAKLDTSPHRDGNEILATLSSAPLRELTGEQVGPYASWAMTTVGNDRDYRHFLPRILELSVTDRACWGADPPVMANKLNVASWRSWPAQQRDAVLRFFRAAFDAVLSTRPEEYWDFDLWFCGLVKLGDSASQTFELWRSNRSPKAALHLASFAIGQAKNLQRYGEVRGPFWEDVDTDIRRDVARHLTSDDNKAFLQAATDQVSAEERIDLIHPAFVSMGWQF